MTSPASSWGQLLLAPVTLGDSVAANVLPATVLTQIFTTQHFVVENPKAARAQLKQLGFNAPIASLNIEALPKKTSAATLDALLAPAFSGENIAFMSDAGCPAIADPGNVLVTRAHHHGIRVVPLVGPSSILLAIMASGLNGQSFTFHGYLPVDAEACAKRLRALEKESQQQRRTQLFIETPYRNERLLALLLKHCQPSTRLCIACDLTTTTEWIHTCSIMQWRQNRPPQLDRRPAIFLLLAESDPCVN